MFSMMSDMVGGVVDDCGRLVVLFEVKYGAEIIWWLKCWLSGNKSAGLQKWCKLKDDHDVQADRRQELGADCT